MAGTTRTGIRETCPKQGRRKADSDRSQSVRSNDEASNDRGAKGHRKEEMQ